MPKYSSFPGLYEHLAMRAMYQYFGKQFVDPPEMNDSMLKYGEAKSPEYACLPFKIYLGYFRDLAQQGVSHIFVHGTRGMRACRYLDLWEGMQKTLRDEGYTDFTFYFWGGYGAWKSFRQLKKVMGGPSLLKMLGGVLVYSAALETTDLLNDMANRARPRELEPGATDKWLEKWLTKLKKVNKRNQPKKIYQAACADYTNIKQDKGKDIIKVAFTGDLFKVHEPFFHFDTIRKLNQLGVEVKQPESFSLMFIGTNKIPSRSNYTRQFKYYVQKSKKYLRSLPASYFDLGIGEVIDELDNGAEGIIHFQSFGCMPDIMFKPILDRIGKDYNVPVLHFMRDTHASDAAYQTRLEAFVDLIKRKKK